MLFVVNYIFCVNCIQLLFVVNYSHINLLDIHCDLYMYLLSMERCVICVSCYTEFTLHNYGTARVRHGLFGPRLHCGNQRRAHGVINRHVSSRAYSRLYGGCYATVMALYSCSSRSLSLSSSSPSSLKRRRQRMRLRFL